MIAQMQAVTGRKPKRRYVDIINARTPYLPSLYAAREQRGYQDEMAGLEEDRLSLEKERLNEDKRQAEKALKLQEDQANEANKLALVNLGLNSGLGYGRNKILKDVLTSDAGNVTSGSGVVSSGPMGLDKAASTGVAESSVPSASSGFLDQAGSAFTKPGTYGYAGIGALGGKLLGGKDRTKSALIGAGIGAGLNFLGGGSITGSIISGLLGGVGGGLF